MEKIKVAVLDDHDVFRDSLKLLLDHEPDLSVVAVAEDGFQQFRWLKNIARTSC